MGEIRTVTTLRNKRDEIQRTIGAYERKLSQARADLAALGVREDEKNVRNKLSRGKFTAAYLLQCLEAIGAQSLRLD